MHKQSADTYKHRLRWEPLPGSGTIGQRPLDEYAVRGACQPIVALKEVAVFRGESNRHGHGARVEVPGEAANAARRGGELHCSAVLPLQLLLAIREEAQVAHVVQHEAIVPLAVPSAHAIREEFKVSDQKLQGVLEKAHGPLRLTFFQKGRAPRGEGSATGPVGRFPTKQRLLAPLGKDGRGAGSSGSAWSRAPFLPGPPAPAPFQVRRPSSVSGLPLHPGAGN